MALIYCEKCGGRVSDKALACPHCGAQMRKEKPQETKDAPSTEEEKAGVPGVTSRQTAVTSQQTVVTGQQVAEMCPQTTSDAGQQANGDTVSNTTGDAGAQQGASASAQPSTLRYQEQTSGGNKAVWWIVGIVFALLLIGAGVFVYMTLKSSKEVKESVVDDYDEPEDPVSAGLTFDLFSEIYTNGDGVSFYDQKPCKTVAEELRGLGFELLDRTVEERFDVIEGQDMPFAIETYTKTVGDRTTTVKLEEFYSEIHFPNVDDALEFEETVRMTDLTPKGDGTYVDNEEVYWGGTDVEIKGTIAKLNYRFEP